VKRDHNGVLGRSFRGNATCRPIRLLEESR
jgi:hypothetical protein